MTRDEALEQLKKDPCEGLNLQEEMEYVIKKLGLNESEFEEIMARPIKRHEDYPSAYYRLRHIRSLTRRIRRFARAA